MNVGHGHVYPREDGVKARCGGPAICSECALDLARKLQQDATAATPRPTVGVLYSCHGCHLVDREVPVRERYPDEDVVDWVHFVSAKVGHDHRQTSPQCRSDVADLKIPLAGKPDDPNLRVGQARRQ